MTIRAEVEDRQDAEAVEVSKKLESRAIGSHPSSMSSGYRAVRATSQAATFEPQFSSKQVYFTVSLYGILLSGALWATINVLNWVWHKLL